MVICMHMRYSIVCSGCVVVAFSGVAWPEVVVKGGCPAASSDFGIGKPQVKSQECLKLS
jgi:hypothetical protein